MTAKWIEGFAWGAAVMFGFWLVAIYIAVLT